ncbi:MAG: hypothetical protein Kow0098_12810 [Ignavibacteriaceae bacterium]
MTEILLIILVFLLIILPIAFYFFRKREKPEGKYLERIEVEKFLEESLKDEKKPVKHFKPKLPDKTILSYKEDKIGFEIELDSPDNKYLSLLNGGVKAVKDKNYESALQLFNSMIEDYPNDGTGYYCRGVLKNFMRKYKDAIEDLTKSVELNFKTHSLYFNRGFARVSLKEYRLAVSDFLACIDLRENDAEAFYFKGKCLRNLNQYEEAITDLSKTILINPLHEAAYFERGMAKINSGQKESGCADLKTAFEKGYLQAHHYIKTNCE